MPGAIASTRCRYCGRVPVDDASGVEVTEVSEATPEVLAALRELLPQLSTSAGPLSAEALAEMVAAPGTAVLVARHDGQVVGSLTLVVFRVPTGLRAWIEDVVVAEHARGAGIGASLCRAAIARARSAGARNVDLTSRPSREAANRLYQRLGFVVRQTNLYRLDLGDAAAR